MMTIVIQNRRRWALLACQLVTLMAVPGWVTAAWVGAAEWEPGPAFPDDTQGREYAAGVNQGGTLFAIGGSPFSVNEDAAVHYLPPGASAWSAGTYVEGPVVRQAAGIDSLGRIIVFAGRDGLDPQGDPGVAYWYDIVEGQQGGVAQRSGAAPADYVATAVDDVHRIYSIGGGPGAGATPGDPNSAHVERYDGGSNVWTPLTPMPAARADAAAVYDGSGRVLVIGGIDATATSRLASVTAYDISSNTWADGVVADLPAARSGLRAVLGSDGRVYAIGGEEGPLGGGTVVATTYVLDLSLNQWSAGPSMATARKNFAATLSDDHFIYAMGGSDGGGGTHLVEKLYTPPCPAFSIEPASRDVWSGQIVVIEAEVDGGVPMTLQWRRDGEDLSDGPAPGGGTISGATTPALRITDIAPADAGQYTLAATNPCGTTLSAAAFINVVSPPSLASVWTATVLHPAWGLSSVARSVDDGVQVGSGTMPVPDYGTLDRPILWSGSAASAVDMTPSNSVGGALYGVGGEFQVGWWWWPYPCQIGGQWYTCYQRHACHWRGTPDSNENIQLSGWEYGAVYDTDGVTHVGTVSTDDEVGNVFSRAGTWGPPGYFFFSLHPASGVSNSGGAAIDGDKRYGWIHTPFPGPVQHAAMWGGTAASFVDLNPGGATRSAISGAGDGLQVGYAEVAGQQRPTLWAGAPNTNQDMLPSFAAAASVQDTEGGLQVGAATIDGVARAGVWSVAADSFFDLHQFLGPEFGSSIAYGLDVDPAGVVTVVGSGYNTSTQRSEAVMWRSTTPPVPGDHDGDGDVDLFDFQQFHACVTGPDNGPFAPGCEVFEADGDDDTDFRDFGAFQRWFTGP